MTDKTGIKSKVLCFPQLYTLKTTKHSIAEDIIEFLKQNLGINKELVYRGIKKQFFNQKNELHELIKIAMNQEPVEDQYNPKLDIIDAKYSWDIKNHFEAFGEQRFKEHFHKHFFSYAVIYHKEFVAPSSMDVWKFKYPEIKLSSLAAILKLEYDPFPYMSTILDSIMDDVS